MRVIDDEGNAVGVANKNPLLDTRKYHVEFLDGSVEEYTVNNIAEIYYLRWTKKDIGVQ